MRILKIAAWVVLGIGVSLILALASEAIRLVTIWLGVTVGVGHFAMNDECCDGRYHLMYVALCLTLVMVVAISHSRGYSQLVAMGITGIAWFVVAQYMSKPRKY